MPGADLFKTFETCGQFGLEEFLAGSFAIYERYPPEQLVITSEFQFTEFPIEIIEKAVCETRLTNFWMSAPGAFET